MLSDLVLWGWRSGRWWFPVVTICLAVTAVVAGATQVVLPKLTYALF